MFELLQLLPTTFIFRSFGILRTLPFSLTLSVSYKCNFRCKTCNIAERRAIELSVEEWDKIFKNYKSKIIWATISGGEPFLRKDLFFIVKSLYDNCHPKIINIPTNGYLTDQIVETVKQISQYCRKAHIVINVSIDELEEKQDEIRGVKGAFKNACETINRLKFLNAKNVSIGIHTVVSKFNVDRIPEIFWYLKSMGPDSIISEIAEKRVELKTMDSDITPTVESYKKVADFLVDALQNDKQNKIGTLTRILRVTYYTLVVRILKEKRQVLPCYSGFASAQIAPDGDVWFCCVKAVPIGNLRESNFNFKKMWYSDQAKSERKKIKQGTCFCPLANAAYTNMMFHFPSLFSFAKKIIFKR